MSATDPSLTAVGIALMPHAFALGVEVDDADASVVTGRLAWAPDRCTAGGVMHGGALMTLADSIGAICAHLNLPAGSATSTIESKTNFFRAVSDGFVMATAWPVHVGRTIIVVQVDLVASAGHRVGLTTQTQAVITPRLEPDQDRVR